VNFDIKSKVDGMMGVVMIVIVISIVMGFIATQIADPDTDATLKTVYGFFGGILGIGALKIAWDAVSA
jgi:hypothetical protein